MGMVLKIKNKYGVWVEIPAIIGASAYDVAVRNGFVGTEEEWLESLKGDPFTYEDFTPEQLAALKGADGYNPVKGVDYFDGKDGSDYVLTADDKTEIADTVRNEYFNDIEAALEELHNYADALIV